MKLTVNYQKGVLNLPALALEHVGRATKKDLAVLLAIASEPGAASDFDGCRDRIALAAGVKTEELTASIAFWRGAGVYIIDDEEADDPVSVRNAVSAPDTAKKLPKRELPELTADDVKNITSSSPERLTLIDACQETMGKMFNTAECSVILGLKEYYGVEDEYLIILAAD